MTKNTANNAVLSACPTGKALIAADNAAFKAAETFSGAVRLLLAHVCAGNVAEPVAALTEYLDGITYERYRSRRIMIQENAKNAGVIIKLSKPKEGKARVDLHVATDEEKAEIEAKAEARKAKAEDRKAKAQEAEKVAALSPMDALMRAFDMLSRNEQQIAINALMARHAETAPAAKGKGKRKAKADPMPAIIQKQAA